MPAQAQSNADEHCKIHATQPDTAKRNQAEPHTDDNINDNINYGFRGDATMYVRSH